MRDNDVRRGNCLAVFPGENFLIGPRTSQFPGQLLCRIYIPIYKRRRFSSFCFSWIPRFCSRSPRAKRRKYKVRARFVPGFIMRLSSDAARVYKVLSRRKTEVFYGAEKWPFFCRVYLSQRCKFSLNGLEKIENISLKEIKNIVNK